MTKRCLYPQGPSLQKMRLHIDHLELLLKPGDGAQHLHMMCSSEWLTLSLEEKRKEECFQTWGRA